MATFSSRRVQTTTLEVSVPLAVGYAVAGDFAKANAYMCSLLRQEGISTTSDDCYRIRVTEEEIILYREITAEKLS